MAIQEETIKELLRELDEYLYLIENMSLTSEDVFLGSKDIQHMLERRLHIAVELCIDIASHLAAGLKLPGRDTAKSIFAILEKEEIITSELTQNMQDAVGFRNILVHEYGKIDHKRIYRTYKDNLNDMRQFAKEVVEFLEKK